ncbi:CsbD family protein [Sporosarcina oncorhynchi]|uniref:CsbD family protein n=1 Tax=Sporosarcina oncorhynchi TaxID=3056444 RepID=A0ABZ0L5H4_9BACL|nr:CsbD family protein [Sporosarcina sp. T2O-4]WOV87728.1 CsbD family protein [Sporosarcina sp. T2O-4]
MKENGYSDKVKGAVNKVKGEAKDQYGNATGDAKLQAEGKLDKLKGNLQDKVGDFKERHNDNKTD